MNNNLTASSFLNDLRENTSELHTALENLPISKVVISPDLSKSDYALYLKIMYNVVTDIEQNIFPVLKDVIPDLETRYKAEYIVSDLKIVGTDTHSDTLEKPISKNISDTSTGFALGIMYVIEGSSLGGRVILKNIQAVLGYDENNGARYFAGYGKTTGSNWKNFLEMIVDYQEKYRCEKQIIAGANYTFKAIAQHLKENSST